MDNIMTQVQIITAMVLQTMMHRGMGQHVGGQRVTCLTEVMSIMDTTGTRFMRKLALISTRVVVVTLLVCMREETSSSESSAKRTMLGARHQNREYNIRGLSQNYFKSLISFIKSS